MLPCQLFLAFYIWGAHWRHLKNTTEPSMCGGDAALCQITLTTCSMLGVLFVSTFIRHCMTEENLTGLITISNSHIKM